MPTVTVCVGQAGTQLGANLFATLHSSKCNVDEHFRTSSQDGLSIPRSLLIDTEPKVILKALEHNNAPNTKNYKFLPANCVAQPPTSSSHIAKSGAGNNFAMGYSHHAPLLLPGITSGPLRSEIEHCDSLSSINIVHSAGGGTGSGCGTKLTECVKDIYGGKTEILNVVVLPFNTGEVIVQDYNVLLTLGKLTVASDCVITLENETLMNNCKRLYNLPNPQTSHLNSFASEMLTGVFAGSTNSPTPSKFTPQQTLRSTITSLVPTPQYKFPTLKHIPMVAPGSREFEPVVAWATLLRTMGGMQKLGRMFEGGGGAGAYGTNQSIVRNFSCANVMFCRGGSHSPYTINSKDVENVVVESSVVNWNSGSSNQAFTTCYAPVCPQTQLKKDDEKKSITLLTNNQEILPVLDRYQTRALEKFDSGAYLHRYEMHGIERGDFEESFRQVEQVMMDYQQMQL